jgi:hypothetical protein
MLSSTFALTHSRQPFSSAGHPSPSDRSPPPLLLRVSRAQHSLSSTPASPHRRRPLHRDRSAAPSGRRRLPASLHTHLPSLPSPHHHGRRIANGRFTVTGQAVGSRGGGGGEGGGWGGHVSLTGPPRVASRTHTFPFLSPPQNQLHRRARAHTHTRTHTHTHAFTHAHVSRPEAALAALASTRGSSD